MLNVNSNKVIAKNTLILYIKLISVSILSIFTSRIILNSLGVSDFGLYNVVGGIVFMMAFLNNIMVTTSYRYIAFELGKNDVESVNKIFNISLVIHICIALIVLIFAEIIGSYYIKHYLNVDKSKVVDALFIFHFSVLSTIFSILSVPFQGLIIAKENFFIVSIIDILRGIFSFIVAFVILNYTENRLKIYSVLMSIVTIIPPILFYIFCKMRYKKEVFWNFQKKSFVYKEMASFSGWVMFGASAAAAEVQVSILLINSFFGTAVNASFSIANQVNNLVKMFAQSINQSFIPQLTKSISVGDEKRSFDLVVFTSKYSFFLILFPAIPILLFTNFILKLWLKNPPEYTYIFVQFLILTALIRTINAGLPALVQATGKIKYFQLSSSLIILAGLPLSYLFYKKNYPPYTLSIIFFFMALIDSVIVQFLLKRVLFFDTTLFFKRVYIKCIMVCVATIPLFIIKSIFEENLLLFITLSGLSIPYLIFILYKLGMNELEKNIVTNQLRKIFFS